MQDRYAERDSDDDCHIRSSDLDLQKYGAQVIIMYFRDALPLFGYPTFRKELVLPLQ